MAISQVYSIAKAEHYDNPALLVRIMRDESGIRAEATNVNRQNKGPAHDSTDWGWYQINDYFHPEEVRNGCALDLACSTKWSIAKLKAMPSPCPFWSSQCKK